MSWSVLNEVSWAMAMAEIQTSVDGGWNKIGHYILNDMGKYHKKKKSNIVEPLFSSHPWGTGRWLLTKGGFTSSIFYYWGNFLGRLGEGRKKVERGGGWGQLTDNWTISIPGSLFCLPWFSPLGQRRQKEKGWYQGCALKRTIHIHVCPPQIWSSKPPRDFQPDLLNY